jgi:uncharacterized membrane protein
MSWLISVAVALLTGLVCGAGSFWLSYHAVVWYRVSSFEGKSGFAIVGLTMVGAIVGCVLAFVAARVGVAWGWAGFGGQLLWAMGICMATLAIVAIITRCLADVPPTVDGRELDMHVEVRLPADQIEKPQYAKVDATIELGAMASFKRVVRARRTGMLHIDQVRHEDGRWIVPGEVDIFTTRGKRILLITLGPKSEGFLVPLPARPAAGDMAWSDWLPRDLSKSKPGQITLSYRYRVQQARE